MKRFSLFILALASTLTLLAQPDYSKLSGHLANLVRQHPQASLQHSPKGRESDSSPLEKSGEAHSILALMKLNDGGDINRVVGRNNVQLVDSIGAIYIIRIPLQAVGRLSNDADVMRIEAERMPHYAMDTTPAQVNATDIYTGNNLPQAFTGEGVIAGVFDGGFDFTHPAFMDADGRLRVSYYYDFLWPNDDGTLGHALYTTDEIADYGHSQHVAISNHGTHVMGIMAGSAVDGKYQGMAPGSDIYVVDFNSSRSDFSNPDEQTSAVAVLGFKYIFDQAEKAGKPCVVNFSSCESITLTTQRILEGEALLALTGPGHIIVSAAGNDGFRSAYAEKEEDVRQAGVGIINGIGSGEIIDMDIVTPVNQRVRFDFLGIKLLGGNIEGTIIFDTDSVDSLQGDTCLLATKVSMGDISLKVYASDYQDPRGKVYHVDGHMPSLAYLVLCGATCLLTGDGPAWLYSDLFYSPFVNISGSPTYSHVKEGYSVSWPATLDGIISVGATGYKNSFVNIDGNQNNDMLSFAPDATGHITTFSSRGPTFDGRIKPTVTAPGLNINAAYNSFSKDPEGDRKELTDHVVYNGKDYYFFAQSGTSMASPVVAGVVALWLQAKPDLTPDDVLSVIANTSTHPDDRMDYPNNTYGYGLIDAYRGLLYILDANHIDGLSDHQPQSACFHLEGRVISVQYTATRSQQTERATLTVYTTSGRKVAATEGLSIDLSSLPKGVYVVQLNTGSKETTGSTIIRL